MTAPRPIPEWEATLRLDVEECDVSDHPDVSAALREIDALRIERNAQAQRIADLERVLRRAHWWLTESAPQHVLAQIEGALVGTPQPAEETGHAEA